MLLEELISVWDDVTDIPCHDKFLPFFQYFNILSNNIVFVTIPTVCVESLHGYKLSTFSLFFSKSPLTQISFKKLCFDGLINSTFFTFVSSVTRGILYDTDYCMIKLKDGSHQILKINRINIWGNKGLQMMSAMNKPILLLSFQWIRLSNV